MSNGSITSLGDLPAGLDPAVLIPHIPYGILASTIVLLYDYICTLDLEVNYLWLAPSHNIVGAIAFVLNRYLPFATMMLFIQRQIFYLSPEACTRSSQATTILIFLTELIIQYVLYARAYAVWSSSRTVRRIIIFLMASMLCTVGLIVAIVESQHYGPYPLPGLAGCFIAHGGKLVVIAFPLVMVSECIALGLTLVKIWPLYRRCRTPLITHLYQDGLMFCIFILAISVVNMLIIMLIPNSIANFLETLQHVLHSILTTRIILVRATYGQPPPEDDSPSDDQAVNTVDTVWGAVRQGKECIV